jgi:hypothetical protein
MLTNVLFLRYASCIHIKQTGDSIEGVLHVSPGKRGKNVTLANVRRAMAYKFDSSLSLSLFFSLFAKMTTTYTFIRNLLFLFISPLVSRDYLKSAREARGTSRREN